jgi:hypothetical protein
MNHTEGTEVTEELIAVLRYLRSLRVIHVVQDRLADRDEPAITDSVILPPERSPPNLPPAAA